MDWTIKTPLHWDWETFPLVRGKENEISVATEESEWKVEGSIVNGNDFAHPSGNAACSGSEWGNGSSKDSVLASVDSLSKTGTTILDFNFHSTERFSENLSNKKDIGKVNTRNSSLLLAADGPKESLIGLKLGKRTYFEDVYAGTSCKDSFSLKNDGKDSSSSVSMTTSSTSAKKSKIPQQPMQSVLCQVEGCNVDLTTAKEYHRKHRVCERHSKFPKVIVAGQERRFCQQCSRFHGLSEFDQKKRSCRRRLSDHNARRRKPQPETISFNSSLFPKLYHDDRHQINLVFGKDPLYHVTSMDNSPCDGTGGFKLTQAKGSWTKASPTGGVIGGFHFPVTILSNNLSTTHHDLNRLLPFKGTTAEVLDQGKEASAVASALDGEPDLRRAPSLLSVYSWDPPNSGPTSSVHFLERINTVAADPAIQLVDTAAASWVEEQNMGKALPLDLQDSSNHFQEIQLLGTPHDATFDSTRMHRGI